MLCYFQPEFERRKRTKRREIKKLRLDSTSSREVQQLNSTSFIHTVPKRRKQESTDTTTTASSTENDTDTDSTQPADKQSRNVQCKVQQSQHQRARSCKQNVEKRKTRNSAQDESADSAREDDTSQDQKQTSLRTKKVGSLDEDSKQIDVQISNTDHQKDPPDPPRKTRLKNSVNNLPDVVKSPLYYSLSPDVSSDGVSSTQESKQPSVGKTPSVTEKIPITLRSALLKHSTAPAGPGSTDESEGQIKDTPRTAHLKSDALAHVTQIPLSDVKKKMTKSKTLGSSPLDLQREIMSVVMTHKQKRLTEMQERRSKQKKSVSSSSAHAKPGKGTDVYDLDNSSDESEEIPSKIHLGGGVKRLTSSERQKLNRTNKVSQTPVQETSANGTESDSDFTAIIKSSSKSQNERTSVKLLNASKSAKPKGASKLAKGGKSGGVDRLRTRSRTRTRSNENNTDVCLSSDGEEEQDISSRLRTSRYKDTKGKAAKDRKAKSKAVPKRTLRSKKAAKQPEEITIIDSDSDSRNSESSDSDASRTSDVSLISDQDKTKRRVSFEIDPKASKSTVVNKNNSIRPSRKSKRNAAQKIKEISSIVDSESSGTEMMSLRSRRNASLNQKRNSLLEEEHEDSSDEEVVPPPRITRKATRRLQKSGEGKNGQPKKQSVGARVRPRKDAAALQQDAAAGSRKDKVSPSTEKENAAVNKPSESNGNDWSAAELTKLKR